MHFPPFNRSYYFTFRSRSSPRYPDYVRRARQDSGDPNGDLHFSDETPAASSTHNARASATAHNSEGSAAPEQAPVKLAFPGNDFGRNLTHICHGIRLF